MTGGTGKCNNFPAGFDTAASASSGFVSSSSTFYLNVQWQRYFLQAVKKEISHAAPTVCHTSPRGEDGLAR